MRLRPESLQVRSLGSVRDGDPGRAFYLALWPKVVLECQNTFHIHSYFISAFVGHYPGGKYARLASGVEYGAAC